MRSSLDGRTQFLPKEKMTVRNAATSAIWWIATILILVLVDDFTYGPIFWALSQLAPVAAVVSAFAIYWLVQVMLVREATKQHPHRLATALLRRLQLDRRNASVAHANSHSIAGLLGASWHYR